MMRLVLCALAFTAGCATSEGGPSEEDLVRPAFDSCVEMVDGSFVGECAEENG